MSIFYNISTTFARFDLTTMSKLIQVVLDDTGRVLALGFLVIIACLVQILRSNG